MAGKSRGKKALGVAAGVAVVGAAAEVARRRIVASATSEHRIELGSLRGRTQSVIADDGVPLHVEIDDYTPPTAKRRGKNAASREVTLVFCHGYALSLDAWHFQRAGYRDQVRAVYYDHRSHGRSGRGTTASARIDQLAKDLLRVIEQTTGDEPVILIGHSMGGMTILQLAADYPELFASKVAGVGLISTTGGGFDPAQIVIPLLPDSISSRVGRRVVGALRRVDRVVDVVRHWSDPVGKVITDAYAFGSPVPRSYTNFVFELVDRTPFEVVAEFYTAFDGYNEWGRFGALTQVPTSIIGGAADRLTPLADSRRLHAEILGSDLLELPHAGHMAFIEHHTAVNAELDQLIARAQELVATR